MVAVRGDMLTKWGGKVGAWVGGLSQSESETESVIFACGWKSTDLCLISDTAPEDKVQEKMQVCPQCVFVLWLQTTKEQIQIHDAQLSRLLAFRLSWFPELEIMNAADHFKCQSRVIKFAKALLIWLTLLKLIWFNKPAVQRQVINFIIKREHDHTKSDLFLQWIDFNKSP